MSENPAAWSRDEEIPVLANLASAVFIPLREDVLADDPNLPRDRVARLEHIICTLNAHRNEVRQNILWLFEREKNRIITEAIQLDPQEQGDSSPDASQDEVDRLLNSMRAPADPAIDYAHTFRPVPERPSIQIPTQKLSLHEDMVQNLLNVFAQLITQLNCFETYMNTVQAEYFDRLEKEVQRIDEAGKRPEERLGSDL